MSNDIQVFEKAEFGSVRAIMVDDKPWFVAKDVCKALDLDNVGQALSHLREKDRKPLNEANIISNDVANYGDLNGSNGGRSPMLVSESGLYDLVLGSRKAEALQFKYWIIDEVIPSIMKYGMYATLATLNELVANPDLIIQLATQLKEMKAKNTQLQHQKNLLEDKVEETQADIAGLVEDLRYNRDYCTVLQWEHLREFFDPNDGKVTNKIGRILSEIGNQIGNPPIPVKSQGFHFPIKAHHKDAWGIFLRRLQNRPDYLAEYRIDYMAGNIDGALHA